MSKLTPKNNPKCPHCETDGLYVDHAHAGPLDGPYTRCSNCGLLFDAMRDTYYLPTAEITKLREETRLATKRSTYEAFMLQVDELKAELASYGTEPMYTFAQVLLETLKLKIKLIQKELDESE